MSPRHCLWLCAALLAPAGIATAQDTGTVFEAPYVPSPLSTVDEMLRLADVGPREQQVDGNLERRVSELLARELAVLLPLAAELVVAHQDLDERAAAAVQLHAVGAARERHGAERGAELGLDEVLDRDAGRRVLLLDRANRTVGCAS